MRDVVLIALGITAEAALESLAASCRVTAVVRPVDAANRSADPVLRAAGRLGVPVFGDASIDGIRTLIARLRPACVVISSYDRVLPPDVVESCPCVNVHYAPLPRYRGRANVNWAVINGEPFTAITIHVVDPALDAGNVLFQQRVPIERDDTVADLYAQLNALQLRHLGETVVRFLDGDTGWAQQGDRATYGCTRLPADGEIDWHAPAIEVARLVRGLVKPFPGAFTYLDGSRLVIWRARAVDDASVFEGRIPGRVVAVSRLEGHVDVLARDGVLRIFEVERDSGAPVPAASIIRSVRATLGLRPSDLMSRLEALEREVASLRARLLMTGEKHAHV